MKPLSQGQIENELKVYGVVANCELSGAVLTYVELLLKWNSKISLTTVTDPTEIVRFHFGESFFAGPKLGILHGRLADVGSGAGFPGLPLKMLSPEIELYLIEPNLKKAAFLSEVTRELKLDGVEVVRFGIEDLPIAYAEFDVITSRALGRYASLLRWSRNRLSPVGKVALWVGDSDATELLKDAHWTWRDPLRVPASVHRVIVTGIPNLA